MNKESKIIARDQEIKELDDILESQYPEFLLIYGRRRIGKTFLIHQYFHDKGVYFELTGIKDASLSMQLQNFAIAFSDVFNQGKPIAPPKNWLEAFTNLRYQIEECPNDQKIILFFDELPWLASPHSKFLQAIEHFWNSYLSKKENAILIVCGSAAAWMIHNVLDARGGLHGRVSKTIRLLPFNLIETERFLQSRGIDLDRKQIMEIYMVMGGVGQYLTQIKKGYSSRQIIQQTCFSSSGYLFKEFHRLYASLFDNYEHHISIIQVLAKHSKGLNRDEILKKTNLKSGGFASKILNELQESGFISGLSSFEKKKSKLVYRLIDPFSLFYLKWIEPVISKVDQLENDYWMKQQAKQTWSIWSGYAFENICFIHIKQIKRALGFLGVQTTHSQWKFKASKEVTSGAQIDLVIDRADHCINLCEIKFYNTEYIIDKDYAETLNRKKELFREATKTKKTLFNTLIASYGAKKNKHYLSSIEQKLSFENLFQDSFI